MNAIQSVDQYCDCSFDSKSSIGYMRHTLTLCWAILSFDSLLRLVREFARHAATLMSGEVYCRLTAYCAWCANLKSMPPP